MYLVRNGYGCGIGDTLREAVSDYEFGNDESFDPEECVVYEVREVEVERIFVVKEQQ